jgi:hypothetical protein
MAQAATLRVDDLALAHQPEQGGDGPGSQLDQERPAAKPPGKTLNQGSLRHHKTVPRMSNAMNTTTA